jgi:hypothetical protein
MLRSVGRTLVMNQAALKRLALLMTMNCVRNTVIEDYHAAGKLSESEMKAFNQEVANKIYTFLRFLLDKPIEEREAFLGAVGVMYPSHWDQPKMDESFVKAVKLLRRKGKPRHETLADQA